MGRVVSLSLAALACLVLAPAAVSAQQAANSVIAGTVRDTSGAVLPGVTVEATSPALIEKVRTVVTDGQGQYRITDLRPGTYDITFTLPGFSTVRREGLELPSNFTATVNSDLRVGALEETVTVSGQSPVVDVQTLTQSTRLTAESLDNLPISRNMMDMMTLNVGATIAPVQRTVGGSAGEMDTSVSIHGGKEGDQKVAQDGMRFTVSAGAVLTVYVNPLSVQDLLVETAAGGSAEYSTGGVQLNSIPKDGGNTFRGEIFTNYANRSMQTNNLSSELRAKGLTQAPEIQNIYDLNGAFGGPIKRDKLWFFTAQRRWGISTGGVFYFENKLEPDFPGGTRFYEPDFNRELLGRQINRSHLGRLTFQASRNNKLTFSYDHQPNCDCPEPAEISNFAPEAGIDNRRFPNDLWQTTHTFVASNRLLFETGYSLYWGNLDPFSPGAFNEKRTRIVKITDIPITESSTGFRYNANTRWSHTTRSTANARTSVSYITGTHQFKAGLFWSRFSSRVETYGNVNQVEYTVRNRVPISLTQFAGGINSPRVDRQEVPELDLYVQDRVTLRRLTVSGGLRFGQFTANAPPTEQVANRFLPARSLDGVDCIPCWNDLQPRVGVAYDVFGTAKTALKASVGKYLSFDIPIGTFLPANATVNAVNRAWTDANGNFIPDCDLVNLLANGECGQVSDLNFGGRRGRITSGDPDWIEGWGKRGYSWRSMVAIDHELLPNVGLSASYHRAWYGNFRVTDNTLVGAADFDPYCITAPVHADLPGGGGYQICGLYDIKPEKFGQVNTVITHASKFGKQTEVYNGAELTINARFRNGALAIGGFSIGNSAPIGATPSGRGESKSESDRCFVVDSPQELYHCHISPPFRPTIKISGAYPLPGDVQVSATYHNTPGAEIIANYPVLSTDIAPSLGRPLAGGTRQVTIPLIAPVSMFEPRVATLDLRATKRFQVGRLRAQAMVDFYNVLNASTVILSNATFGPNWRQPERILGGGLAKVGLKLDF